MFEKKTNPLDVEITHILFEMSKMDVGSEEYNLAAQSLKILAEAREKRPAFPIAPEAVLAGLVNLFGIALILKHEEFNVISTRAIGFIRRP